MVLIARGRAIEPGNPELILRTIQLYHHLAQLPAAEPDAPQEGANTSAAGNADNAPFSPSPIAARVLAEEREGLLGPGGIDGAVKSLVALAEDCERGSLRARVCAAQAIVLVSGTAGEDTVEARAKAVLLVRGGFEGRGVTVNECISAVEAIKAIVHAGNGAGENGTGPAGTDAVEELRRSCAAVFPVAEAFPGDSRPTIGVP